MNIASCTSPLLSLPPEVRSIVYQSLFDQRRSESYVSVRMTNFTDTPRPQDLPNKIHLSALCFPSIERPAVAILLACRQTYADARSFFYAMHKFRFSEPITLLLFLATIGSNRKLLRGVELRILNGLTDGHRAMMQTIFAIAGELGGLQLSAPQIQPRGWTSSTLFENCLCVHHILFRRHNSDIRHCPGCSVIKSVIKENRRLHGQGIAYEQRLIRMAGEACDMSAFSAQSASDSEDSL